MLPRTVTSDPVEILRTILSNMELKVCVESSEELPNGTFKITTCNTYYLNKGFVFNVDNNQYEVVDFLINEWLIYKRINSAPILTDCFIIPNPKLLVGTPSLAKLELEQLKHDINRMPFVWILELFTANYSGEGISPYANTSPMAIFLFNEANRKQWLNIDHREQVIRPMKSLLDAILLAISKSKLIGDVDGFTLVDRVDFGTYSTGKGNISSILPETISGVEINITLPIFGENKCSPKNKCK